ncbi:P-loop containing nucleoside triphosphate hydrolase [Pseudocohnilembus persalinus]|uniref:p-loop containing nucleoside triphosphate hydrolase n=1 Tax=Pseudocohnilembus persalinus TaxID=266149 RepID=A0A0V0QAB1_PSEPJ|nr:P-loop containing nucleoside triphosphate hydrolase [Pseudocohnilembus persalinus]|eukprot:KRW99166.1 P-loop containing nucleoside triphosphate hydrolase [Pseudocohnilembus persalinus]
MYKIFYIYSLLGHNGSGKTTFINLLTGMIKKNSGQIQFSNHGDLDFNYDNIRQNIGLCSQKDVLYDDLTVVEHLRFYGKLKGKKGQQLEDEIFNLIPKIGLQQEFTKQAKNLSGGNKRKLSLGMALIGSSKIILLDEPTSGMDSISRRQLWDILETIKEEQRTIILTTHHLEEAEALADRIGIMNKGKLVIVGSSDFIKKNFGVGYHLYLNPKYNQDQQFMENKQQFIQIVNKYIPDNQVETQTQKNQLKITLPFKSQDQFIHVFEELEQFGFLSINLEMNTLEETFINIEQKSYDENEGDSSISIGNGPFSYNERNILTFQPKTYILRQSYAMFVRQIRLIIRNWEAWIMISFGKLQDNVNVSDYLQGEINNFENIEIQQPKSAPGQILRRFLQQMNLGQNMNQQQNDIYEQENEQQHLREQQMKEWKLFDSQNAYILWLIFDALIYILLVWYLDNRQKQIKKCNNSKVIDQFQNQQNQNVYHSQFIENNQDNQGQSNLVQSVQNEQQRVIQNNFEDQIQMIDVHKVYPNNFYALKGINFGVKKGEIFALLGPNGAGKSSTFNLLTAKLARTRGSIYLNHLPIEQGFHFSNNIGICPQKDSLWDNLSPIEHIKLFARIKGMDPQEAQNATEFFIKYLDLIDNQNNMANNLSGGNKRRLCVAISMIGAPQLGFFDEPSTGLDPISKRYLWNLLQQSNQENNSSFLLTTHSMPEAESLCQRIGILINGQFRCIDTLQNLKQTYGKGNIEYLTN